MSETLDLSDLAPKEIEFQFKGKYYLLREATEAVARAYTRLQYKFYKAHKDGTEFGNESIELALLAGSVFDRDSGKEVDSREMAKWPTRLVAKLYEEVRKISELDQEETVEKVEAKIKELKDRAAELKKKGEPAKNELEAAATS